LAVREKLSSESPTTGPSIGGSGYKGLALEGANCGGVKVRQESVGCTPIRKIEELGTARKKQWQRHNYCDKSALAGERKLEQKPYDVAGELIKLTGVERKSKPKQNSAHRGDHQNHSCQYGSHHIRRYSVRDRRRTTDIGKGSKQAIYSLTGNKKFEGNHQVTGGVRKKVNLLHEKKDNTKKRLQHRRYSKNSFKAEKSDSKKKSQGNMTKGGGKLSATSPLPYREKRKSGEGGKRQQLYLGTG